MSDPTAPPARRRQEGQAAMLALVALAFAAAIVAGTVRIGVAVAERGAVQAGADAVALAVAADGPGAAGAVAAANHVSVVSIDQLGTDAKVTVRRGGVAATARARWVPRPIP